ncbi:MAG: hypothetical protein AB9856_20875 [Cellulosilyticaceae bacterium]
MAGTLSDKDDVVLGSGDLYIMQYKGTLPENTEIETVDNKIGHIKGGATLTYKVERKEVVDDMGVICKRFLVKDSFTFKSGMLSWNGKQLAMLCSTATVKQEPTKEKPQRILEFGGKKNDTHEAYVVHFVHTKDNGKKIRITIVGNADNGFSLAFDPEKETVVDAEFGAISQNEKGTLVLYSEEVDVA